MKKILVIEDNSDVRENLEEILELSNYEVVSAENGKQGIQKAMKEKPDLILCDVMMPELDGYGVLHILSKKPNISDIPFIFLTAKSEKTDFRKGMNLGADDYITKPFDDVELLDAIEIRLRKSEKIKENLERSQQGNNVFIDEARGMSELNKLSKNCETKVYKKKELIFEEDEYPKRLFCVNKGKVKTFKTNEDGKEFIIHIYKEGEFFGVFDLLKETKYSEAAAVLEDTELSIIPKVDFLELLYSNRDVSSKLIKMLANSVTEKEDQLIKLAYNSVRKRVSEALILLHNRYVQEGKAQFSIHREDLASMVGTAKEVVIRTLTDFKHENLIQVDKTGKIVIIDGEKLKELPN
ncbi:MAG: response regulator [Bacteroidetes bacterium]|nr:response regulator [Bacteroidota bacterium]